MTKAATQSSDGRGTSVPNSRVRFHAIDDAEGFYAYGPGGYHPVAIGDRLGGQYRILNKLGHGSYSTVWLARDEALQRLVAVKICMAESISRESEILSLLRNRSDDGALGRGIMPILLKTFRIDGPNGTHTCLVTDVARRSLAQVQHNACAPLMLPVARAIAAQLILAVNYLHGLGIVHGDLHLGNVLLRLPQEYHLWSDKELLERCGEPELQPVTTFDDKPIPPGVPTVAILPIGFPSEPIEKIPLSDAHIVLADFGEAYLPSQESKLRCCAPAHSRPPEDMFEPTKPKSFPSDIWTLGCSVWAALSHGPMFETFFSTPDSAMWLQVQALGKLPDEWWEKWDARSEDFTEEGQPLRPHEGPVYTLGYQFEDGIQEMRKRKKMELMKLAEKEALFAMLRPMMAYRPEQRCSIKDVLDSDWMTEYGMLAYEEMCALDQSRDRGTRGSRS